MDCQPSTSKQAVEREERERQLCLSKQNAGEGNTPSNDTPKQTREFIERRKEKNGVVVDIVFSWI